MHTDIPTMLLMNIAASVTLAFAVGWVANAGHQNELRRWAHALALYGLSFVLLALRDKIPDLFSVILANLLLSCCYSVILSALAMFQQRKLSLLAYCLPPLAALIYASIYADNIDQRIIFFSLLSAVQLCIPFFVLVDRRKTVTGRGKQLLSIGLVVMFFCLLYRALTTIFQPDATFSLLRETSVQTITFLCAFCMLILTSVGFTLMILERADERIRQIAMQDALTGAWNRAHMAEAAHAEMARMERYGHPVALIMADLDHFKRVNDTYGHATGDQVLKSFCDVVRTCIRTTDLFGRWGGEEFLLLLPNSGYASTQKLAERIRATLEQTQFPVIGNLTASFGFAVCHTADVWENWLNRADMALYRAKANGRNRVEGEIGSADADGIEILDTELIRLNWNPGHASGNALIDRQHAALIDTANEILGAMQGFRSKSDIQALALRLLVELRQHFADEEIALQESKYGGIDRHIQLHKQLLARAHQLIERYARDQLDFRELYHFLSYEVLAQHMLTEDRLFFPLIADDDVGMPPASAAST